MKKLLQKLGGMFPRRRRRMWRYVSPRRHRIGALVLVVLVGLIVVYNMATSDARVARRAKRMLREATHCQVEIESARFSLFSGVRLKGVTIRVPGDPSKPPIVKAREVFLRHEPWRLFTEGTIEPVEVLCWGAEVTILHRVEAQAAASLPADGSNLKQMMDSAARWGRQHGLPDIRITDGRLRQWTYREGELIHRQEVALAMVGRMEGTERYKVTLGQPGAALLGSADWDLATGRCRVDLAGFQQVLPEEYRKLFARYHVDWGKTRLEAWNDTRDLGGQLVLDGVSLRFPLPEGDLRVDRLSGVIVLSRAGGAPPHVIELKDIRGRLVDLSDATVGVSGTVRGASADSPFDIRLDIRGLRPHAILPDAPHSPAPSVVRSIRENYHPAGGAVHAGIRVFREPPGPGEAVGPVRVDGTARLDRMTMSYDYFPYRMDELSGPVDFHLVFRQKAKDAPLVLDAGRAEFGKGITARHGTARIRMTQGVINSFKKWDDYTFAFEADDVSLDGDDLKNALLATGDNVWKLLSPRGQAGAVIGVKRRPGDPYDDTTVTLKFDGRAGLTYRDFRYPIDAIEGTVLVHNDKVTIQKGDPVRARHGPARLMAFGTLDKLARRQAFIDLTIDVLDAPLDAALTAAVPEPGASTLRSLRAAGQIKSLRGQFSQPFGKELDYAVTVELAGVNCAYDQFPYRVSDINGRLVITPRGVALRQLTGRHAPGDSITVDGDAYWRDKRLAADLTVAGRGIGLDADLAAALPPDAREIWRTFSPSGSTDVTIQLHPDRPEAPGQPDYTIDLHARGAAAVRYEQFPYPFKNLEGHVIFTPRQVRFLNLKASDGPMEAVLNWTIDVLAGRTEAGRSNEYVDGVPLPVLVVKKLPIDGALLSALPKELSAVAGRIGKSGKAGAVLDTLHLVGRTRGGPGGKPAGATEWAWDIGGAVDLEGASIELGMGAKTMHGSITGSASRSPAGVGVDARISLHSLKGQDNKITAVQGRITKRPEAEAVTISDFSGTAYGGAIAGNIDLRLGEDLVYEVRLEVNGARLEELFDPGAAPASGPATRAGVPEKQPVTGRMQGRLEMVMTAGKSATRKASGEILITKAKIFKLPIPLELLHVIYLTLPGPGPGPGPGKEREAFNEGRLIYRMQGPTLILTEIAMSGTALSVLGSGTVDVDSGQLNLVFVTGPPRGAMLPRIQEAGPLFRQLSRELMEVQVTGTLEHPQMRTVQLPGIDEALRKLMNPEGRK